MVVVKWTYNDIDRCTVNLRKVPHLVMYHRVFETVTPVKVERYSVLFGTYCDM